MLYVWILSNTPLQNQMFWMLSHERAILNFCCTIFILFLFYRIKKFSCKNSIDNYNSKLGIIFIDAGKYILFNWTRMEQNINNNNVLI